MSEIIICWKHTWFTDSSKGSFVASPYMEELLCKLKTSVCLTKITQNKKALNIALKKVNILKKTPFSKPLCCYLHRVYRSYMFLFFRLSVYFDQYSVPSLQIVIHYKKRITFLVSAKYINIYIKLVIHTCLLLFTLYNSLSVYIWPIENIFDVIIQFIIDI